MSLDLYEIGRNLILDDGINGALDGVIGKVIALQEATDRVNIELGFSSTAVADLTGGSADVAASWTLAAEAAERAADAVGKAHMTAPIGGVDFVRNESNPVEGPGAGDYCLSPGNFSGGIAHAAVNDQAAFTQYQPQFVQTQPGYGADRLNAVDVSPSALGGFTEFLSDNAVPIIPHYYAQALMGNGTDSNANASALASQRAHPGYVIQGFGDDQSTTQAFSRLLADDLGSLVEGQNPDRSGDFDAVDNFVARYRKMTQVDGGKITPQNYQTILDGVDQEGWKIEDHALVREGAGTSAMGAPSAAFVGHEPVQKFDDEDVRWPHSSTNQGSFGQDPSSCIPDVSEHAATRLGFDEGSTLLNALYFKNFLALGAQVAAGSLFENGIFQQQLTDNGTLPDPQEFLGDMKPGRENTAGGLMSAFDGFALPDSETIPAVIKKLDDLTNSLNRLGERAKTYSSIGYDIAAAGQSHADGPASAFGFGSSQYLKRLAAESSAVGAGTGEAAVLAGVEGIATASGPPGWLVALTSAVVMELTNTMFHNNASTPGGPTASRQSQLGPSGTCSDPLHVRVVDQQVSYQTHMPTAPTSNLPSQSLPIPGQVLFSP